MSARRAMLGKVHIARKDLALEEDSYRDLLERLTGKRSAADCSDAELDAVLAELARLGWRPKRKGRRSGVGLAGRTDRRGAGRPAPRAADSVRPLLGKMRALWRALYDLGEVADPDALAGFVKRQAGVDAPEWVTPEQANSVIEALKDWCARAGFRVPAEGLAAKRELLRAQWRRLNALGAVHNENLAALDSWLQWKVTEGACAVESLTPRECEAAAARLGRWLRKAKAEAER